MPDSSSKSMGKFATGFWVVNGFLGILLIGAWLISSIPAGRAFFTKSTPTPPPTLTLAATFTPSITPTQTSTHIPTASFTPSITPTDTLTPIPYSEGPLVIGLSVQNRPLEVYRFGTGPTERLIVAGMHGGSEFNTIQLADRLITYLRYHPEVVPSDKTLYILRDLNPDGEARAHNYLGRVNANNVDLNRNWDANWQKDWVRDTCWNLTVVSPGKGPMSEPETKALAAFIESHSFDALINYHSAALGIFAGGLPPDDYSISLAKAVAAVSTYPYPPIDIGCEYTGGFTDWANEKGIAALDIELTDHTHDDYEMNLKVLDTLLNWKR